MDKMLTEWHRLRGEYDPWYEFADDFSIWAKHSSIRWQLYRLRTELGLWGQGLVIPMVDRSGRMREL